MGQKIGLSGLVAELALRTGESVKDTEDFVKGLFEIIANQLSSGESVKVSGLGVFKVIEVEARKSVDVSTGEENMIPAHKKVTFVPVKELASAVNAPFEMFQTVELPEHLVNRMDNFETENSDADEVEYEWNDDNVKEITENQEGINEKKRGHETEFDIEDKENIEDKEEDKSDGSIYAIEDTPEDLSLEDQSDDGLFEDSVGEGLEGQEGIAASYYNDDESRGHRGKFWIGFLVGLPLGILLILGGWWCYNYFNGNVGNEEWITDGVEVQQSIDTIKPNAVAETETENISDSQIDTESVPTQPSDMKIYDTITKTRYLTTMAKDHYGNFHLWPYIYKENEKILGHPNHIRPGTQVVIPDLKKYGVDPKNRADIEKAKKMGAEIYARYQ